MDQKLDSSASDQPAQSGALGLLEEQAYARGYAKAIREVLFHLRYHDWQEDTAAEAVEVAFGHHPHVLASEDSA